MQERQVLRRTAIVLSAFLTSLGRPAEASLTPGWTPFMSIQNIIVNGDEAILVMQSGIPAAYLRDDCNASIWNVINLTSVGGRARLATALSAYSMNKQVSLALQACDAGRPAITHLQM